MVGRGWRRPTVPERGWRRLEEAEDEATAEGFGIRVTAHAARDTSRRGLYQVHHVHHVHQHHAPSDHDHDELQNDHDSAGDHDDDRAATNHDLDHH